MQIHSCDINVAQNELRDVCERKVFEPVKHPALILCRVRKQTAHKLKGGSLSLDHCEAFASMKSSRLSFISSSALNAEKPQGQLRLSAPAFLPWLPQIQNQHFPQHFRSFHNVFCHEEENGRCPFSVGLITFLRFKISSITGACCLGATTIYNICEQLKKYLFFQTGRRTQRETLWRHQWTERALRCSSATRAA